MGGKFGAVDDRNVEIACVFLFRSFDLQMQAFLLTKSDKDAVLLSNQQA